jgi:hypothetical protein
MSSTVIVATQGKTPLVLREMLMAMQCAENGDVLPRASTHTVYRPVYVVGKSRIALGIVIKMRT